MKDISTLFANNNLRCTKQRQALYLTLSQTTAHPTADELFQSVKGRIAGMSRATVYNTLDAFSDAGIITKIPSPSGPTRYDATTEDHLHMRDSVTGIVRDVPHELGSALMKHMPQEAIDNLEKEMGFKIDQIQIELIGKFNG